MCNDPAFYDNMSALLWAADESPGYADVDTDRTLQRALRIDEKLRMQAPDGWRGVAAKEQVVKRLIYEVVSDTTLVERLFAVIKAQREY
jgi:type I restriction enzyme, R subunit